jgi:hypothetical protein
MKIAAKSLIRFFISMSILLSPTVDLGEVESPLSQTETEERVDDNLEEKDFAEFIYTPSQITGQQSFNVLFLRSYSEPYPSLMEVPPEGTLGV